MEATINDIANCYILSETWFHTGKFIFDHLDGTKKSFNLFSSFSSKLDQEGYNELYCMEAWIAYDRNLSYEEFIANREEPFLKNI